MKMMTTNTKIKPAALVVVVAAFALVGGASIPSAAATLLAEDPPGGDTSAQSLTQQIIDRTKDRVQDTLDELGIDIDISEEPSNGNGPIVGEEPPCRMSEDGTIICG